MTIIDLFLTLNDSFKVLMTSLQVAVALKSKLTISFYEMPHPTN